MVKQPVDFNEYTIVTEPKSADLTVDSHLVTLVDAGEALVVTDLDAKKEVLEVIGTSSAMVSTFLSKIPCPVSKSEQCQTVVPRTNRAQHSVCAQWLLMRM